MNTTPEREPVTFVIAQLAPRYGIESAAANVIERLSRQRPTSVVVLAGPAPALLGDAPVTALGLKNASGVKRLLALPRLRHVGRGTGTTVLVGAWVAVPWLLANPECSTTDRVIVWEHSFTEGRVAADTRVRVLWSAAQRLYGRARILVAPGRPTRELLAATFDRPVASIPNLVPDTAVPTPAQRQGVLVIGRLEPVKRVDLALRAYARSGLHEPLTVLGDGSLRGDLEALADELGIAEHVEFTGTVPHNEVLTRLAGARALLHTATHETFGLAYLEASNAGVPVISTRHPAADDLIPEIVPGTLASPDVDDLAEALLRTVESTWDWQSATARRERQFGTEPILLAWHDILDVIA